MKTEKLPIFEKVRLWFEFEGQYYHRDFIKGVKNLIRWFPTIWKDRDWDDHFIWEIMIKKIKFQSDYIGKKGLHTRAERDSEIMNLCVSLMDKVRAEHYGLEYQNYNEISVKFVPTILPNGAKGYEYKSEVVTENFKDYFAKYPRVYKKVVNDLTKQNKEFDNYKIAIHMSMENHKKAKRILFKLMENNIENWWD